MKRQQFHLEQGSMTINDHKMSWTMKRSKNRSAFGLRGSRIFYLLLQKDGLIVGEYDRGWDISKKPYSDDEESMLCIFLDRLQTERRQEFIDSNLLTQLENKMFFFGADMLTILYSQNNPYI